MDGITWLTYDNNRVFQANYDPTSVVTTQLQTPLTARAIRINPYSFYGHICMRIEVYILSDN